MNPYRLALPSPHAMTCLDSPHAPNAACDPPTREPRKRRIDLFLAGTAFAIALGGFAFQMHRARGHIEIAPAALTRAHSSHTHTLAAKTNRGKPPPQASAHAESAWVVGGSHDDKTITARARALSALGLDLTVVDVPLSDALARQTELHGRSYFPMKSIPLYGASHHVDALEIHGVPADSPLRVAGIADGDQLLAINGYRFDDDSFPRVDILDIEKRGSLVVELSREGHHVLLNIHWHKIVAKG